MNRPTSHEEFDEMWSDGTPEIEELRMSQNKKCEVCNEMIAVTRCGTMCLQCLREKIKHDTPFPKHTSDQLGRTQRSLKALGGSTDISSTDDLAESEDGTERD